MDVTLCLTHACNLRCGYCYAGRKFQRPMPWGTARRALDFAFEQSLRNARRSGREAVCQIGFFGGEPLLEWNLLRRASDYAGETAERLGIRLKYTVTTNLTLLDEPKATWLRERGFFVGLSIDGHAAMHDSLRRVAGGGPSHADCAGALRFFRGEDANGEVIVVLDPRNIAHLPDAIEWLIGQGIRRISLNPNFSATWTLEALGTWSAAYERIGELFGESFRRDDPVSINVLDGKIHSRIRGGHRACDQCGFGDAEIAVSAAGYIYPCERLVGDDSNAGLRVGDVRNGFDPVARNRILASRGSRTSECLTCPVRDRCANGCGCVNYAGTGFIDRVPGLVCHHEKLSIRVADEVASTLFSERNPRWIRRFYGHLLTPE